MCRPRRRRGTARMSVEPFHGDDQPAPSERVLFWLYQLASYITLTVIDDAAMLAFAFS